MNHKIKVNTENYVKYKVFIDGWKLIETKFAVKNTISRESFSVVLFFVHRKLMMVQC